jgi:CubicO group peptidase (beta-lactamase class C family)
MGRRFFLQRFLAAPLLVPAWKSAPPASYIDELRSLMRAAPVPGAVIGAIHSHKLSWIVPIGVREAGAPDPVTSSTLFQAASLTKQVAVHAAFALRATGKLDFDRPLVAYLDDLPNPAARTVTARHVLSHSSGFPNWRFSDPSPPNPCRSWSPHSRPGRATSTRVKAFSIFSALWNRSQGSVLASSFATWYSDPSA